MRMPGRRTHTLVTGAAALTVALAGCGGGGADGASTDSVTPPSTTTGAAPPAASFLTLANAVCRAEVSDVPAVPEVPSSGGESENRRYRSETRRYVAAVERAAGGLADAFVVLERRRPESQDALGPLVTKARAVVRAARGAAGPGGDASGPGGIEEELRVTIALLNEATSEADLPTCSL